MSIRRMITPFLSKRLKPHRLLAGPMRGAVLVTSWHDYPGGIIGRTEAPLINWLTENVKPGETWLDIGGHYGYIALAMARFVGGGGRVFSFEPILATAGCLAQSRALNGLPHLRVIPMGLGDGETIDSVQIPTTRGMADRTLTGSNAAGDWNETISVAKFDWLWPRIADGDTKVHGVKIDVQGMELEVLRGMFKTLAAQRPKLVVELHTGVQRAALSHLLTTIGYRTEAVCIKTRRSVSELSELADDHSYIFEPAGVAMAGATC